MQEQSGLASKFRAKVRSNLRDISGTRKHVYFYLLLILATIAAGNLKSVRDEYPPLRTQAAKFSELQRTLDELCR